MHMSKQMQCTLHHKKKALIRGISQNASLHWKKVCLDRRLKLPLPMTTSREVSNKELQIDNSKQSTRSRRLADDRHCVRYALFSTERSGCRVCRYEVWDLGACPLDRGRGRPFVFTQWTGAGGLTADKGRIQNANFTAANLPKVPVTGQTMALVC